MREMQRRKDGIHKGEERVKIGRARREEKKAGKKKMRCDRRIEGRTKRRKIQ